MTKMIQQYYYIHEIIEKYKLVRQIYQSKIAIC